MSKYDEDKEQLRAIYSDMHKDVYGIRSSLPLEMSVEEMEEEIDRMQERVEEVIAEDEARRAESVKEFQAKLKQLMSIGAESEERAIEWLLDSYKEEYGFDFLDGMDSMCFLYEYDIDSTEYGEQTVCPIVRNLIKTKFGKRCA